MDRLHYLISICYFFTLPTSKIFNQQSLIKNQQSKIVFYKMGATRFNYLFQNNWIK